MPAYGQTALAYAARNANSVAVLIGDTIVAFAQTASHGYGLGTEAFYGIGSALPQEIQQLRIGPDISIDTIALTDAGMAKLAGSNNIATLLSNNKFDLHITDGLTNQVLLTYVGCVASNFSESIPANRPVTQSISFLAMDVLGPDGTTVLVSPSAFSVNSVTSAAGAGLTLGLATG